MCRHRAPLPTTDSEATSTNTKEQGTKDAHFLLDIFTLCSVAFLICILILYKAIKKKRLNQAYQSEGTQTSNPVLNLDESINRLSSELTTLHARF